MTTISPRSPSAGRPSPLPQEVQIRLARAPAGAHRRGLMAVGLEEPCWRNQSAQGRVQEESGRSLRWTPKSWAVAAWTCNSTGTPVRCPVCRSAGGRPTAGERGIRCDDDLRLRAQPGGKAVRSPPDDRPEVGLLPSITDRASLRELAC